MMPTALRRVLPLLGLSLAFAVGACRTPSTTAPTPIPTSAAAPGPSGSDAALNLSLCHVTAEGTLVPMTVEPAAWSGHEAHGDVRVGAFVPGQPGYVYGATCQAALPRSVFIGFDGLSEHQAPFSVHATSGITVTPIAGDWLVSTVYGQPAPFIYFMRPAGAETMAGDVRVTAGGGLFRFLSVELYSSTTRIPYEFIGRLGDTVVFEVRDELPNTFGRFAYASGQQGGLIDSLLIRVVNPSTGPCCQNPVGLDNIIVLR